MLYRLNTWVKDVIFTQFQMASDDDIVPIIVQKTVSHNIWELRVTRRRMPNYVYPIMDDVTLMIKTGSIILYEKEVIPLEPAMLSG